MLRSNAELRRLFPVSEPLVLNRQRLEDIIDNRMFVLLDYAGLSPGSTGVTVNRDMKITTLGTHNGRLYFRGFQVMGPSISAGFLISQWRLFMLTRSLLITWRGTYWNAIPPGYVGTDQLLTNLYNL